MARGITTVPVDKGLVTSRDASTLTKGEMSRADDSYYEPNDPGLWKVNGRTQFNSTKEPGQIVGFRFLEFDGDVDDAFVLHFGQNYRVASAGKTGSFADLKSGLSGGETMDSVHYNNSHFLLNGVDRNFTATTVGSNGTTISLPDSTSSYFHGMTANTSIPVLSDDGLGAGFQLADGNFVTYWVEERYKVGDVIVKRSIADTSTTVTLTNSTGGNVTYTPRITHATMDNADATHWALYSTAGGGLFPTGAEISEVALGVTFIDDLRTTNGAPLPSGATYEVWVANIFGTTQVTPRWGPPPIATTGDVFEDSLVLNDISDPSLIKYSFPDSPHAFPAFNFIRFETREHDEVKVIRRMGSVIMIGLRNSLWMVRILPRPEDAQFNTTRVKQQVEGALGVVGTYAATTFSYGQGLRFAYVSVGGVVVANEASWDVIDDDIDWRNTVEIDLLSSAVLKDNPKKYRLELYYTPKGGTSNTEALYYHYHPFHSKGGGGSFRAKVTGPINVKGDDADIATLGTDKRMFTASVAQLFLEDEGSGDESSAGGINYNIKTGDDFLYGIGGEGRVDTFWVHHDANPDQFATATITQRSGGDDDTTDNDPTLSLERREHTMAELTGQAEAFQFGVENSDSLGQFRVDYFVIKHTNLGESTEE